MLFAAINITTSYSYRYKNPTLYVARTAIRHNKRLRAGCGEEKTATTFGVGWAAQERGMYQYQRRGQTNHKSLETTVHWRLAGRRNNPSSSPPHKNVTVVYIAELIILIPVDDKKQTLNVLKIVLQDLQQKCLYNRCVLLITARNGYTKRKTKSTR